MTIKICDACGASQIDKTDLVVHEIDIDWGRYDVCIDLCAECWKKIVQVVQARNVSG